ncbi:hypothetical protein FA13DRAFT_1803477 [Coprinellus micaceus]|uniref:Uncharacterized protein n=1 Tax=Coprinellus micaceus TaxID=71717 RepID=A0A4Y7SAY9_COPMI|nr:hypothetical protein FA13DRAFT_1803477 [Coprinellus micaceus]
MSNAGKNDHGPRPSSLSLDKVINQQSTTDDTHYHAAALVCLQRSKGPGWLYHLEGRNFYSPNCYRPNIKVPLTPDPATTSYNSFFNEWDLCRYRGAPDDDQLLFQATVQARMRGTTVQAELAWWRVYYGLPPEPLAPTLPWAEKISIFSQEDPRAYPEPHLHPRPTQSQFQQPMDHLQSASVASMEDGEIADPNVDLAPIEDLSWIARRTYHFFGFTLPLDHDTKNPHEHAADPKFQTPAHAPRLLGVPKTPSTVRHWSSREGQAIIRFAKSLDSMDPPEPSACDLHQWNATPVAALPLFKSLKSFSSAVVIRVDEWDNVKGRSTPELSSRIETAYWLDIPSKDRTWLIGCMRPELALTLCRLGQDFACNPLSIAMHLAEHGVPFNTWFKRQNIQPVEGTRRSPHLIQFRPDSQYQFSKIDYDEYVRSRRRLLDGSPGRAALKAGGIVWRISKQDIGIRSLVSGEPSQEVLDGQRALRQDNEGNFLVDDSLNQDEIMAMCGEYEIGIRQGNQRGRTLWWPPPDIWDECYGTNGWSHAAEEFFQSRLTTIAKNFTPMTRSSWRDILRTSSPLKKARGNLIVCLEDSLPLHESKLG